MDSYSRQVTTESAYGVLSGNRRRHVAHIIVQDESLSLKTALRQLPLDPAVIVDVVEELSEPMEIAAQRKRQKQDDR